MVMRFSPPIRKAALALFPLLLAMSARAQIPAAQYGAVPQGPQVQKPPAAAAAAAPAAPVPEFTWSGVVGLSETYTTNVAGTAGGSQGDFDSRLNLQLNALEHSSKLTAALSYTGSLDEFVRTNSSPVISTFVTGYADYRAIPEYLRLDLRAYAQPILLNPLGPVTAPGTPLPQGFNGNTSDVYSWLGSATLDLRFGSFATSELTPAYGMVYFVEPPGASVSPAIQATLPPSQVTTVSVVETITSGDDFSRLFWQILGSDLEQNEKALGLKQREGIATVDYAITREVVLLLNGGYQAFQSDTPLTQGLTGPIGYAGLRLQLSQKSSIQALAGQEYHRPSYVGDASFAFTPLTSLTAHVDDYIQTPAGRLIGNLSGLGLTVLGSGNFQFLNNNTGLLTFNGIPVDDLAFINVIERYRDGQLILAHRLSETAQVSLMGFGTIADILSAVPVGQAQRQNSWGATVQGTDSLSPKFNVFANATYGHQNIFISGNSYISAVAGATYSFSPTLSFNLTIADYERLSSPALSAAVPASGSANVATITIGVQKAF